MDPDSQVSMMEAARNFNKARMNAFWQDIWALLTGKSVDLLSFEEVKHRVVRWRFLV